MSLEEELKKDSKLSKKELEWINKTSKELFFSGHRLYVLMCLCSAIIGNLIIQTGIKKDIMSDLIKDGVED